MILPHLGQSAMGIFFITSPRLPLNEAMHHAHSDSLHLKIFYLDIGIGILILVARAKDISVILVCKFLEIIESVIESNNVIADVCGVLLTDDNVISLMNSGIDHRVALGNQNEEFSRADE